MITQTHPEISITFRRLSDDSIAVQSVTRASADSELSQMTKAYSQAISARWNDIVAEVNKQIAAQATEEQIH